MTIEQLSEEKKKLDDAITRAIMDSPLNANPNVEIGEIRFWRSDTFAPNKATIITHAETELKIK